MRRPLLYCLTLLSLALPGVAWAGTITAQGSVVALTHINQMNSIDGTADFDEGPTSGGVPLDQYSPGLTWHTGALTSILPGVTTGGSASQPVYDNYPSYFPSPSGGGTQIAQANHFAGVATFGDAVTQVGLTASTNGTQYLTAWDTSGTMLGQVTWVPGGTSGFVGIDTLGVPIGMIAYGNDNLWTGGSYGIGGSTIISDSWVWSTGACSAANVTVYGQVSSLSSAAGVGSTLMAEFDEGPTSGLIPLKQYSSTGLLFQMGPLADILPGVTTGGSATQGSYTTANVFPTPICGGGTHNGQSATGAGVATFSTFVDRVGLTTGANGVAMHLTAWDTGGVMLGQISWTNDGIARFIGLDTGGVAIGMVAYGNDDLWGGADYDITGDEILTDTWRWGGTCTDDAQCDDSNVCNGAELCVNGDCEPGTFLDCDDQNLCTADSCDPATGCVNTDHTEACDDGDICTENDVCASGSCSGTPLACDDDNFCTLDTCDSVAGCEHQYTTGSCNDGDACTQYDTCAAGECIGEALDCDDDDVCTSDSCDSASGCANEPIDGCCNLDHECGPGEVCGTDHTCVPGSGTGGAGGAAPPGAIIVEDGGCSCRVAGSARSSRGWGLLAALALLVAMRRRRRATGR